MGGIEQFIPLILIFRDHVFLMIRPRQKKISDVRRWCKTCAVVMLL